ncbi:hypothetical protein GCM10010405_23310 [Streptomyces macrosporus]|uniref:Uncharacterized protein n=1 Tax=Streptomyces macrosporus TaxID=44032 RepID=A0ABN3JVY4_9ACTN
MVAVPDHIGRCQDWPGDADGHAFAGQAAVPLQPELSLEGVVHGLDGPRTDFGSGSPGRDSSRSNEGRSEATPCLAALRRGGVGNPHGVEPEGRVGGAFPDDAFGQVGRSFYADQ